MLLHDGWEIAVLLAVRLHTANVDDDDDDDDDDGDDDDDDDDDDDGGDDGDDCDEDEDEEEALWVQVRQRCRHTASSSDG